MIGLSTAIGGVFQEIMNNLGSLASKNPAAFRHGKLRSGNPALRGGHCIFMASTGKCCFKERISPDLTEIIPLTVFPDLQQESGLLPSGYLT
jgi:hypothetical protein